MKHVTRAQIHVFQDKVFLFYKTNGRKLPWRKTTDPYMILLSEFMLQQTQVPRVILYYKKWIKRWPTIHHLATASRKEVLQMWMGLGYNKRALSLHKTVQIISQTYRGDVLLAMNHFRTLPGVGLYTSNAVQIFAANEDIVTVDTNIRRIFIHEFHLPQDTSKKELWALAKQCLPNGKSRTWHNALMDYGSLVLTAKKTGIAPCTRQSRFEGSDRQIRANILRILLVSSFSYSELSEKIDVDNTRLRKILEKLIREEIIILQNKRYQIREERSN
ncbi:MAG: Fe-S cluster assembly protein HesB [Euryarchaeota archaeon]|nr:Fe-S cluster assembly protein HesB [Euryarchaeota archaeon]